MGVINYDAAGLNIQALPDARVGNPLFAPAFAIAGTIAFDETTNPNLINTIGQDLVNYTVVGGVLQYKNAPVAIAADAPATTIRKSLLASASAAVAANNAFLALATPTQAQAVAQVQALTRQLSAVIQRLIQFTT